ncbi:DUF4169 family protein [Aquisalinus flavus]|uniref:DUF4169 domain-containing protein n=1 Tax=Aquisalinus flavus TaxID=1526572 RepID=A0A8J2Y3Z6_9PROT|nr:DUF4169 family protein [Aquisalinus flavus]MBD0425933.1 DUF4169 family protein [Aquisalinus flavus]UNE48473.1 DUF4169 family protein [Aquisalinus flavus]GGD12096.1 DUF4169 domain-containing protein [Aquisalinus flavus]
MADIVNLRRFRKARKRADAETAADANRRRHGRSKPEKQKDALEADQARRTLDGARLDKPDTSPDTSED